MGSRSRIPFSKSFLEETTTAKTCTRRLPTSRRRSWIGFCSSLARVTSKDQLRIHGIHGIHETYEDGAGEGDGISMPRRDSTHPSAQDTMFEYRSNVALQPQSFYLSNTTQRPYCCTDIHAL